MAYPQHWEADVVLSDGGTVHVRPITPADAPALIEFHARLSPETIYRRFFAPMPRLSEANARYFTEVDQVDRVALVATLDATLVGVARYDRDRDDPRTAETAFVITDRHQGRGVGSALLEHLAAAALERGVHRFVADVLPSNRAMIAVLTGAGFAATRVYDEGTVRLTLSIDPTAESTAVMRAREQRAEARSVERLLAPRAVAVVGASRDPASVGGRLLAHLRAADPGFTVHPVNPAADTVAGLAAYPSVRMIPGEVDLAVVATPAAVVPAVVADCIAKGVHGLVVATAGYADAGPQGAAAQAALVAQARGGGMRVIGPNCLGVQNTDGRVRLNASLAPALMPRGSLGLFCQSGGLGIAVLESVAARGLGLSTFVSAGNRADVSGNDLLQFWDDDEHTDAVLLYLETFGNPRKFARLARRLARRKPVVVVSSAGAPQPEPDGGAAAAPVEGLFHQAGVIRVDTVSQLLDVAQLLSAQPHPAGGRVAVVGSAGLRQLAERAIPGAGLRLVRTATVAADAPAPDVERALADALAADDVDAVVAALVPPLSQSQSAVAAVVARLGATGAKPLVATLSAFDPGAAGELRRTGEHGGLARGAVPVYPTPETAVQALGRVVSWVRWRAAPPGRVPDLPGLDRDGARALVSDVLRGRDDPVVLSPEQAGRLLDCYDIGVWPELPVDTPQAALEAARRLGWPVALKAARGSLRHRLDLGGVRLDLAGPEQLLAAYDGLRDRLHDSEPDAGMVVQAMAPPGVACVVRIVTDASFGGLVGFGVAGVPRELFGDEAFRILPLTDLDVGALVRSVQAAPLLLGHRGAAPVDVAALERLLLRVAALAADLPDVVGLELNPVVVAARGLSVLSATAKVAPVFSRPDEGPRRLT